MRTLTSNLYVISLVEFRALIPQAFASYCSLECMSHEDLPLSPAPHAVNARLRARLEGPSPIGWSRKAREPRSRSMSRVRRPMQLEARAPSPDSEVAWSLPAAGANRLVGSRWMGKDYEGIRCWAHGVRGFPDDDVSDDDSDMETTFPIALQTSYSRRPTSSTLSITPKHMSVFTMDDASLATPVTDNCLAQGYVESQSPSALPSQAASRLRRFIGASPPHLVSRPAKERPAPMALAVSTPTSLTSEPVWIAPLSLRSDAQRGRDWGGLYDTDCEKEQLASDRISSYVPTTNWPRGRTRQRAHTDHLFRR
ncbi:hypothetical protein CTheo_1608 [Ceratobasidium theobromae]|uniref:Uncharacterized protein n=1 Tax=Ceratobasidium theobromae TaxID=1582974 RepID=A0A5N5QT88_9AGAM|nr:hypothetical protein CTheo_1608 [Ceratobasidium theobromae]